MWEAYLFQTASGQIGPRVSLESQSWSIALNDTESISATLRKSDLPSVNLDLWLSPWWGGILLTWKGTPIVAGPIISNPTETMKGISLTCGGIRSVLGKRFVHYEQTDWSKLAASPAVFLQGRSHGTIAKDIVKLVQEKPGGVLPISFPIADQTIANDADHQKTYRPFNVSTNSCNDLLTNLSNITNGPDILFKPRLVADNQLTFDMWHGTEGAPRIAQNDIPVWDTTAENGDVTDMQIIRTGTYQTARVYGIGAGSDEGTLIRVATDTSAVQKGFPFLETYISDQSETPAVVQAHAQGNLDANKLPLKEVQITIRADSAIPLGQFWPGDLVYVVTKGWIAVPDGINKMRLLAINGDGSNNVKANLQLEA
jgi:hypothetical protein